MSDLFPDFFLALFRQLKVKFRKKTSRQVVAKRRNLRYYSERRDENPQRENEIIVRV